ncbi:MAG: hypothetical protein B7Z23_09745, partial [Pseudomonadales bacterium 32-61-5]
MPGIGASQHLTSELLLRAAGGLRVEHVPYRGGGPVLQDLLAGNIDVGVVTLSAGVPFARDRRLLPLFVTSAARPAALPEVPTAAEVIAPGFVQDTWIGFFAPTPFGLVILALGIGYMLVARRFLGAEAIADAGSRTSFGSLILDYGVDARTRRYRINAGSPLIGQRLADAEFGGGAMVGVLVLERTRLWRKTVRTSDDDTILTEGDIVVVDVEVPSAERRRLRLEELALTPDFFESYSRQVGMAEVMIAPDSSARGLSVRSIRFREKHDLVVLGVRHRREAAGPAFPVIRLAAGDTLLVAGGWDSIHRLQAQRQDFIMLDLPAEVKEVAPAANQAPFAIGAVLVMVALMMTGIVPNVIAALIACLLMGLFRCVNMPSAYRSIHWPTILLIVGMLPFALALQRTGGVDLVVDGLLGGLGDANPTILLGGVFVLTAVIGLFVSNT